MAPLLIFLMISSLANFLMLVLYHGNHAGRVSWTLLMFTMGAVGIARVAIEKDRSYSLGYAGILGIVTYISMLKFVDSPIFSLVILVVIAYLADRIVLDCTLIDDDIDASGQGLMDSGSLFVKKQIENSETSENRTSSDISGANKRSPSHQPGRTVLYLALAALPLFGLGQFFLRSDPDTWARAQKLLAFYLFASLSLLVTTSFLGLRRYLRQRKADMPSDVSVAWLAGGVALVALILFIAFLAPVPGQLLASLELPAFLDSPGDTVASQQGWGDDAADKKGEDGATTSQDKTASEKEVKDVAAGKNAPAGDVGDGQRDDGPAGKQQGDKKSSAGGSDPNESKDTPASQPQEAGQPKDSGQPNQSGKPNESGKPKSDGEQSSSSSEATGNKQNQGKPNSSEESESEKSNSDNSGDNQSKPEPSESKPSAEQSPPAEKNQREATNEQDAAAQQQQQQQANSNDQPASSSGSSAPGAVESIANAMPAISELLKFIIFVALAAIVAAFVWIHRHAIALWWEQLWQRNRPETPLSFDEFLTSESRVPSRSFASFTNPIGKESDPRRVIVITFAAWEAWSREHGISRSRQETPSEFLSRAAKSSGRSTPSATRLVDAYNRIVYGRGDATPRDISAADELWKSMSAG